MRYINALISLMVVVGVFCMDIVFADTSERLSGRLLLQVEQHGRVWYVSPKDKKRHEVTFQNALPIFQDQSVGITDVNLEKIPLKASNFLLTVDSDGDGYSDYEEVQNGYNPFGLGKLKNDFNFGKKFKGVLFLQIEQGGRIWYVDFDGYRHEVTWGNLMTLFKKLAIGITDHDLNMISEAEMYYDNFKTYFATDSVVQIKNMPIQPIPQSIIKEQYKEPVVVPVTIPIIIKPLALDFSTSSVSVKQGESIILIWRSENADSCSAWGGWGGTQSLSGSITIQPQIKTEYFLICNSNVGSLSRSVKVTVENKSTVTPVTPMISQKPETPCIESLHNPPAKNLTYEDILYYPSMAEVKNKLENQKVYLSGNVTSSGYLTLFAILSEYDGFWGIEVQDSFWEKKFATYLFHYKNEKGFITNVAHALWIEKSGLVPWSLKDYSKREINNMFWNGAIDLNQKPDVSLASDLYSSYYGMDDEMIQDAPYKLFPFAKKFLGSNHCDTIKSLIKWQKKNFFHAYYVYGWDQYKDNRPDSAKTSIADGGGIFYPKTIERVFEERVTGCSNNALILTESLKSLNIPSVMINNFGGHASSYLSSIDRYVHGDHLADFVTIPVEDYLLTSEEITNTGKIHYDFVFQKKYSTPRHYFTKIQLLRDGNDLYLEANDTSYCSEIPDSDLKKLQSEISEFNLKQDKQQCKFSSDRVKIKTLKELSK